jgi:DNA-directed RNA polymerase II subunit RPB2
MTPVSFVLQRRENMSSADLEARRESLKKEVGEYVEAPWDIVSSYFHGTHLKQTVRHQVESFNDFVGTQIPRTIDMFNPVHIGSERDYNEEAGKHSLEVVVNFCNFRLFRPQIHENNGATKLMFPQEARLRGFTYASDMTIDLDLDYIVRSGEQLENTQQNIHVTLPGIRIGKLPVMLRSSVCLLNQYKHLSGDVNGECSMDPGGYFIINGSEKTVLAQERAAENQVYCFDTTKSSTKWDYTAEIKSIPDFKCISPKQITMMVASRNNGFGKPIYVQVPRLKSQSQVPLFVLFRALGVVSDVDICRYILLDMDNYDVDILNALQASIVDANKIVTEEAALKAVTSLVNYTPVNMDKERGAQKKREFAIEILTNDLFPHCRNLAERRFFLGYMTHKLISCSLGLEQPDDRDSYLNKRIDTTGMLLNNLFRNYFNKVVKDMSKAVIKEINNGSWRSKGNYENIINHTNVYKIVKSTTIENGLRRALSTGDFSIKHSAGNKVGVAQVLNRLTYISSISHLRRVNTPIDKNGKLVPPRKLHNTSWGFLCPAETPEGGSIGVVKNLSYLTHVTIPSNSSSLYHHATKDLISLEQIEAKEYPFAYLKDKVKVFVNGTWLGVTEKPQELYEYLKDKKARSQVSVYTSIVFNYRKMEIRLCNDAGRLLRPLLRVRDNLPLIKREHLIALRKNQLHWDDLLSDSKLDESVIEYVDALEQSCSMIAMEPKHLVEEQSNHYKYTHCEIHPSALFGILASCIPFPDNNQSPRNTYQCAMGKQAMGVYVTNFDKRLDKTAYVLNYPMRPLVDTRVMNILKLNKVPSGEQVIVAIMTHTGYNQEDSILFNQGSIDRGLFHATIYHTEKDEDKKIHGDEEIRCRPDPNKTKGMKFGNYNKVNEQGVIPENTMVCNGDVIIAKVFPIKENRNNPNKLIKYEDMSRVYRTHEETFVDKNYIARNGDGYNFCKVRLRTHRKPVVGDKFSSRHGQKGTIGNIIPEKDMPFMSNGLKPDIIINPHAIPSRMTIGQLKETLLGKVLLELGLFGDGTSFGGLDVKTICSELAKLGYEPHGNELLHSGLTGEQMETSIFIGPAFYQRLKHMVNDKQHSRSFGPTVSLTRQPAEGRSRDGGHRFGEMERDCTVSHGASRLTRERLYDSSDAFSVHVCKKCGTIAAYNDGTTGKKVESIPEIYKCRLCDNRSDFSYVELPYACKLLFQELITMNVAPRIMT